MPQWGRPSGASAAQFGEHGARLGEWTPRSSPFRELDNSDEDDGQAVFLDSANYMSRPRRRGHDTFIGDELQFTGYDLAWARRHGRMPANASFEDVASAEEYRYRDENERYYYEEQRQAAYRRHGDLLQSANQKLRKAKEKGKSSVSLSHDEVEALQRSRTPPRPEATPPKTPSKNRSSRSSSTASQTGKKSSKKTSSSRLFGSSSPSASRNKTPKTSRRSSGAEPPAPPAFMIAGPDGVPLYAPAYYPSTPESARPGSSRSRGASRSASREATPPVEPGYVAYHPDRFHARPGDFRPGGDGLGISRNRSASNAQYGSDCFGSPSVPAAGQGRRNVSGPPDISYSKMPRVQARSPLVPRREGGSPAQQWQQRADNSRPGASHHDSNSGSSSEDGEEGVRVDILPEAHGDGYTIERRPVGGEARRRKGRK